MHPNGALVFATASEQVTQRKMQLRGVRVVLHSLNESVYGLVLLLIEQKVQALEIGLGRQAVVHTQLTQVEPRGQPSQHKGQWQRPQQPTQVKVHGQPDRSVPLPLPPEG